MPILMPNHENFSLSDYNKYVGTAHQAKFWKKVSGTGSMTPTVDGFQFTGTQVWELDTFITTRLGVQGIFCNFWHQTTASTTVSIGVDCYDGSKVLLGNRACFHNGAAPTGNTNVYNYIMSQGSTATNFFTNTVYAKVKLSITANTGTYTLYMPVFDNMPYASKALYV